LFRRQGYCDLYRRKQNKECEEVRNDDREMFEEERKLKEDEDRGSINMP
jgi:hypothetical protein